MANQYEILTVKEEMWAKVLMEVLRDNGIPCTALPVHGAGLVLRTGMKEEMTVYVPAEHLPQAGELLEELFSEASIQEECFGEEDNSIAESE